MLWRTHVVGDAIVQTCGKAGRVFTKWARRMPNVPCAVPTNWTSCPEKEEHHEYGYAGKDAWAKEQSQKYRQKMEEVLHQGITNDLYQDILKRTWKTVQDQIGHGSNMKGLKNKVWTVGNINHICSTCGIYVSDKLELGGTQRCRGARNTTGKINGQCCSCRFAMNTIEWMSSCVTARHSCHTCKRRRHNWAAKLIRDSRGEHILETTNVIPSNFEQMDWEEVVRVQMERIMQRQMESVRSLDINSTMVIDTDASMQDVGISWRERRETLRTPIRETLQISTEAIENFMAPGRHNAWAPSTEDVQRSTMTKRRARRLNRCRPSITLDGYRHDNGDNNDGEPILAAQNNNQNRQHVSFPRITECQPIKFTQMRLDAHSKQNTNDNRQWATEARKLKVAWKSRVTGAHPLSAFMKIEAYRMFEYDAETRMYRYFYAHDPGVDLMKFMTYFNVRSVPGVRMHLLDSGSSLFLTPHRDALILGIKTVMNIRGVGGDVAKIKSPLVYTFLDIKGEFVGFHYQSLYLLESLPIPLFATGPAEQQMWSFLLGPSSPCAITSKGRFIPILRCATTGFHWMSERLKAFPTLESRRRIAQRVREMPDHGGLDLA